LQAGLIEDIPMSTTIAEPLLTERVDFNFSSHRASTVLRAQARTPVQKTYLFLRGNYGMVSVIFVRCIVLLIIINILAFILSTDPTVSENVSESTFDWIEGVSVVIFTVRSVLGCVHSFLLFALDTAPSCSVVLSRAWELLLTGLCRCPLCVQIEHLVRIWSSVGDPQYAKLGPVWGRLRYMRSFHALVDFFAVLPWYISWGIDVKVGFATALRVLRMFRLLKLDNYTKAFDVVRNVFYKEKELLLVATFYTFCALLICATIMFLLAPNTKEFK
jgi:hypothetical protein